MLGMWPDNIWRWRGFQEVDGNPLVCGEAVLLLINALQLPTAVTNMFK